MSKQKTQRIRCFREICEYNKNEECLNDEVSIGSSGLCLCVDTIGDEIERLEGDFKQIIEEG